MKKQSLKFFIFTIGLYISFFSLPAFAALPHPHIKPPAPNISLYLDDHDAQHFRQALQAQKYGQWSQLQLHRKQVQDITAYNMLMWIHALRDPQVDFEVLDYVLKTLPNWPYQEGLQSKAEAFIYEGALEGQAVLEWFSKQTPISGEGRAALAKAYYGTGNMTKGDHWLSLAWRKSRLTRSRQKQIYRHYKHRLNRQDHAARADHLVWLGRKYFDSVKGLLPIMPLAERRLIEARMRLASKRRGVDKVIVRVPAHLKDNSGLLFERARWRRHKTNKAHALPIYLQITIPPESEIARKRLWREKKVMIYWALAQGLYTQAYQLTRHTGFTHGTAFAEAEFLAGWISLTHLDKAEQAMRHFTTLKNGVSYPVSLSRASYWQGRAAELLNHEHVHEFYKAGAKFIHTFYGQLAEQQLNGEHGHIHLPPEDFQQDIEAQARFETDSRVRALHIFGEFRQESYFNTLGFHLAREMTELKDLQRLSFLGRQYNYMRPALRSAKQAARLQAILTESAYPLVDPITSLPPKFDMAFVLAVARQESEFEVEAISHARAYGMMQMISSTARLTARKHRLPYKHSRLLHDAHYSAYLGALHLQDLLDEFNGSYLLASAAYNAGKNRTHKWLKKLGDPRTGEISPIDWLESLPFAETRNYVQRVLENMQVYRARLQENKSENTSLKDLTAGTF